MKSLLSLLCLCLCLCQCRRQGIATAAKELSETVVAQRIIKDEGYRMFHFDPATAQPRQLVVRYHGKEGQQDSRLGLMESKNSLVSVQISKDNVLKTIRVDSDVGMVSMEFSAGTFVKFDHSSSQSVIVGNEPFLTLGGPDGELQIVITPRANG